MKAFSHPDPEVVLRNAKHLTGLLDKTHPGAAKSLREGWRRFTVARVRVGTFGPARRLDPGAR